MRRVTQEELIGLIPENKYIAGVDQTAFLLAEEGQPSRHSRVYTMNKYFSGLRVDEFKWVITNQDEEGIVSSGYTGGFSGSVWSDSGGLLIYNLYRAPRETEAYGNDLDSGMMYDYLQDLRDFA